MGKIDYSLKVKEIIKDPYRYVWEIQGFGMLRTYIDKNTRLQIWLKDFIVSNVTDIHTHPWDFDSIIYQGSITNYCFKETNSLDGVKYDRCLILTGKNAYVKEKIPVVLTVNMVKTYTKGDTYFHKKDVPHRIDFEDGTITILTKSDKNENSLAYSYVEDGNIWVSAVPRIANSYEVTQFIKAAKKLSKEINNEKDNE